MVASNRTITDVYRVLQVWVPDHLIRGDMLEGLAMVTGNRSFTETVNNLLELHRSLHPTPGTPPASPETNEMCP